METTAPVTKKTPLIINVILGAAILAVLLWFYAPALLTLAKALYNDEDFSFGLLIPLVCAWIIYRKWPEIRSYPRRPSWFGLVIMALGFVLYSFGELMAIFYFPPVSFLLVLAGLLYLAGGWGFLRLFLFPLFLLLLMIPLPSLVMKHLSFPLQLLSSRLAADSLRAMGYVVNLQGNVIDLGARSMQVVDACSGLCYIFNFLALGCIFCYFFQRQPWKIAVIIISLIPAAIFGNVIRLVSIGIWPILQEGLWHTSLGLSIFLLAFDYLKLVNWLLNKIQPPPSGKKPMVPTAAPAAPAPKTGLALTPYFGAALLLVSLLIPLSFGLAEPPKMQMLQSFDNFPMQLGPWTGKRNYLDKEMAAKVGADDYLDAVYTNPDHGQIELWIAYFGGQSKDIGGSIHSPQHCLPGSGWQIIDSRIVNLPTGQPVRYLLIQKGGQRQVVYYWYFQRGRWIASEYSLRFYMGLDGLTKRRNDGAIVRVIAPIGDDKRSTQGYLTSFSELLLTKLPEFIPN